MPTLRVENLAPRTTEGELERAFSACGRVRRVRLEIDRSTGRATGVARVEMPDREQALDALGVLDGTDLHERTLHVSEESPSP